MLNTYSKILIAVIFSFQFHILVAQKRPTVFDQLAQVNEQWKYQTDVDPFLKTQPSVIFSEQQLVAFHLQQTEKLLRSRNNSRLSSTLKAARESNLNILHKYWQKGVFPVNDHHLERQPYFIDKYNTYCAVGYLMQQSGGDDIAKEIKRTENYSYLFNISNPNLLTWAEKSGLTLDELALIQPGYGYEWPAAIMEFHYNNTGTDVNEYIEIHQSSGGLVGMATLDSVLFYNEAGIGYKKISLLDMQQYTDTGSSSYGHNISGKVYYYLFKAGENFADKGKIELIGTGYPGKQTISVTTYNDVSVSVQDFYFNNIRNYNICESENTPVNTSLTYCGYYNDANWTLQSLTATTGTQNPCTINANWFGSFQL